MKKIFINTISIFLIACIFHFVYSIFPSFITSIFFPVNESIFEHLKLIFTASFVYTLLSNNFNKNNNVFLISYLRSIFTIIILLIIYLPIRYLIGEVLLVTLIILFFSIMFSEILINLLPNKNLNVLNFISIILIIISYIAFCYFTYNPPKTFIFYDSESNIYGIK